MTLAIVMVASACSKIDKEITCNPETFTVAMPALEDGDATKTGLNYDDVSGRYNKLVWKAGDKVYGMRASVLATNHKDMANHIATYNLNGGAETIDGSFIHDGGHALEGEDKLLLMYTGACDVAPLNGTLLSTSSVTAYIQLAIPANQTWVANGIAAETMPMFSYSNDFEDADFHLLGNVLRFNVYNDGKDDIKITHIHLETETGTDNGIAGPFAINTSETGTMENVRAAFGMWAYSPSSSATPSFTVEYDCSASGEISKDSANPTAFNVVISRRSGGGNSNITATFTYVVKESGEYGDPKQKAIVLGNLTRDKRNQLGKIYNFTPAKNVASW